MKKGIKGFSLAELSIVLIIIGLLVGGVMQGGKMVHQAKLRSLANIFQGHNQAVYTFKLSYDALPGDMSNASLYFQGATDGNGDGQILETTSQIISHLKLSSIDILQQSNTGFLVLEQLLLLLQQQQQYSWEVLASSATVAGIEEETPTQEHNKSQYQRVMLIG